MNSPWEQILYRTAVQTFEELCFLWSEPSVVPIEPDAPAEASALVAFSGPLSGTLRVSLYGGLLPVLTANMLGETGLHFIKSQQYDALGEVANVICGNLLPSIAGAQAVFHIGPPHVALDPGALAREQGWSLTETRLVMEHGLVTLRLLTHDTPPLSLERTSA